REHEAEPPRHRGPARDHLGEAGATAVGIAGRPPRPARWVRLAAGGRVRHGLHRDLELGAGARAVDLRELHGAQYAAEAAVQRPGLAVVALDPRPPAGRAVDDDADRRAVLAGRLQAAAEPAPVARVDAVDRAHLEGLGLVAVVGQIEREVLAAGGRAGGPLA